ncbi:hypothetical protein PSHT_07144 [Puccinia striiformis]|uniref:Uncharacterized protein n=1 Tax=Puccinia striiformis TaxID=27350 RepID=A0A2S4W0D4_9BASI|nr:hypothetical protein PSHT_07144 [Puccinia striiformis]
MDAQQFAELIESFREMKTVVQRQQVQIESRDLELSQMRIEMEELKTQRSTKNSLKSMPLNSKLSNQPQSEPARTSKHGSQKKQPTSVKKPVHQPPPKKPNAQGSSSGSKSQATPSATKPPPVPPQKKTQAPSGNKPGQVPPKKAATPPAPADNKRRGLHQMLTEDYPPNFRTTKFSIMLRKHLMPTQEALYTHIRLLWGLIERRDVPTAPLQENLDRFNSHFTSAQQVLSVSGNHSSPNLIVANQVQIMKAAKGGKAHVNKKVDKIDQFSMEYMQGALSKLGLSVWRPDLADKSDSLYNIACRMAALLTFRQLGATPAYSQLNINKVYVNDIPLLVKAYNHYVHFYMLNRYMDELKTEGHFALVEKKKDILHNRNNLRKALNNQYPEQYCEILKRISAHSDDEKEEGNKFYTIKTLPYRSKNANKFFRRLDIDMMASEAVSSTGVNRRTRLLPRQPQPTMYPRPPHKFPIDFYDISWYHNLPEQDKRKIPNSNAVAFLPDASQSLLPKRVPDEKLCSQRFNSKYLAMLVAPYIQCDEDVFLPDDPIEDSESLAEEESHSDMESQSGISMQYNNYYNEGDAGFLYDSDKDDDQSYQNNNGSQDEGDMHSGHAEESEEQELEEGEIDKDEEMEDCDREEDKDEEL